MQATAPDPAAAGTGDMFNHDPAWGRAVRVVGRTPEEHHTRGTSVLGSYTHTHHHHYRNADSS